MKINSAHNQSFGFRIKQTPAFKEVYAGWKSNFSNVHVARAVKKLRAICGVDSEVEFVKTWNRHKKNPYFNVGNDTVKVKITRQDGKVVRKNMVFASPFMPFHSDKLVKEYEIPMTFVEKLIDASEEKVKKPVSRFVKKLLG